MCRMKWPLKESLEVLSECDGADDSNDTAVCIFILVTHTQQQQQYINLFNDAVKL